MPSGVSAATTLSSTIAAWRDCSGDDDDRVRDHVVQTLPRLPEDEEAVDERVEWDDPEQAVDHVAQPEDAAGRHWRAALADDLDAEHLLGGNQGPQRADDVLNGGTRRRVRMLHTGSFPGSRVERCNRPIGDTGTGCRQS